MKAISMAIYLGLFHVLCFEVRSSVVRFVVIVRIFGLFLTIK
jgi:hypothetical protein